MLFWQCRFSITSSYQLGRKFRTAAIAHYIPYNESSTPSIPLISRCCSRQCTFGWRVSSGDYWDVQRSGIAPRPALLPQARCNVYIMLSMRKRTRETVLHLESRPKGLRPETIDCTSPSSKEGLLAITALERTVLKELQIFEHVAVALATVRSLGKSALPYTARVVLVSAICARK